MHDEVDKGDVAAHGKGSVAFAKGISWLLSDAVIGVALTSVVGFVSAAVLGASEYGILVYATAAYAVVAPVTASLSSLFIREFALAKGDTPGLLAAPVALVTVLSALGFLVVAGLAYGRRGSPEAALTTLVAGLMLFSAPFLVGSDLQIARGRARRVSLTKLVGNVMGSGGRLALAVTIGTALAVQTLATLASLLLAMIIFAQAGGHRSLRSREGGSLRHAYSLFGEGWPYMLSGLSVALYMSLDQIILGLLASNYETGQYGMAVRIVSLAFVVPTVVVTASSPAFARVRVSDPQRYGELLQRLASYLVILSLLVSAIIALASYPLLMGVLGPEYSPAYLLVLLLLPAGTFVALGVAQSPWILNERYPKLSLVMAASGAVLNLALNLALIPTMGARGAAIATVVAYFWATVPVNLFFGPARGYVVIQLRAFNLRLTRSMAIEDWRVIRGRATAKR